MDVDRPRKVARHEAHMVAFCATDGRFMANPPESVLQRPFWPLANIKQACCRVAVEDRVQADPPSSLSLVC